MLSLRNRFGIPGVISVIALVFAMFGGAYAASNDNGGGKATASAKAKRGPRGPKGPAGPAGPTGPVGPAGASGEKGAAGANGSQGPKGDTGAAGAQGPKGDTGAAGAQGPKGDTGAAGAQGPAGSPWTAGGTLPVGSTETGAWALGTISVGAVPAGTEAINVPISFTLPLASALDGSGCVQVGGSFIGPCKVHFIKGSKELVFDGVSETVQEVTPTGCGSPLGTVANPKADSGNLCVYVGFLSNAEPFLGDLAITKATGQSEPGAATAGAYVRFLIKAGNANGAGTWAVTG